MKEEIRILLKAVLKLTKDTIANEEIKADVAQYFHCYYTDFFASLSAPISYVLKDKD